MKLRALFSCVALAFAALPRLGAVLVAPPTFTSISIPSTATLGNSISISATAQGNLSDNSDGNNWNTAGDLEILRITIKYLPPGGSTWTTLTDWMPTWQTPNSVSTGLTLNQSGTWQFSFQAMDGRPWYSSLLTYNVVVSPPPSPTITCSLSVAVNQGQYVSYQITATGSPTSYSAQSLPSGLSVNTSTGVISGYIGNSSNESCTIGATNAYGTGTATLTWNVTAAQVTCNGSVSPTIVCQSIYPQSVTLTRNGSANFGIAWTESTVWRPNGTAYVVGSAPLGSTTYTPDGGAGIYWWQYRVVDNYYNYKDEYIMLTVGSITPMTITTSDGRNIDGTQNNATISFGQSITVNATANDPSASMTNTMFAGNYGVSGNWATYGNENSFSTCSSESFSMSYQPSGVNSGTHWIAAFGYSGAWWGQGFNLFVNKATPSGSFQSVTKPPTSGYYTITSSDLAAAFTNPYSGTVAGPTGSVTYKIAGTNTVITAGSMIPSGTTTIEADYAGDSNYAATSITATFTVLGPTPPSNLQATSIGSTFVTLSWSASTSQAGIKNYQVYRNGTLLTSVASTGYTDNTAVPSSSYTYTITATDNSNYVSVPATVSLNTVPDFEVFTPVP